MAGAKIINLVDVRLREEMVVRDAVITELMSECTKLRELLVALHRDLEQLKQGGVVPEISGRTETNSTD